MMPSRLSWRPATISVAGILSIGALALAGPALPPAQSVKPLAADPPVRVGDEPPIQLTSVRSTDPGTLESEPVPLPFTPLAVEAMFDPPRFDAPVVDTAREGPASPTPQALSVPIPAFGAIGVMGVGGAMC